MTYQAKKNWGPDDPVMETDYNRIETGIEDAHQLIKDLANELGGSFVVSGLAFTYAGLTATWAAGVAYVKGQRFSIPAGSIALNANQGQYIYLDTDGVIKKDTSQAVADAVCPLWYFTTNATTVLTYTDRRTVMSDTLTIDQSQSPSGNTSKWPKFFSYFANMIKKITGKTNWYDTPRTTLENVVRLSGDTMAGNLGMGDNALLGVKEVQFTNGTRLGETSGQRTHLNVESDRFDVVTEDGQNYILTARYGTGVFQFKGSEVLTVANQASLHTHVFHIPHTWAIPGDIKIASGDTDYIVPFFVHLAPGQTAKIAKARYRINSGTSATVKIQRNGVDAVTGIVVTPTTTMNDFADIVLSDGDMIQLVVTAVSASPKNMTFTLVIEYEQ